LGILILPVNLLSALPQEGYRIKKVVIDPGHGGKDTGAIGRISKEKDIVLSVGLKLGLLIEKEFPGIEVIYTRKTDVFVALDVRSKIANEKGADLFISIHCNANPSPAPYGAETYVMGLHKTQGNLDVAMRENAVITYEEDYSSKYEGYDPKSSESYIIFSLIQNAFLDQSLSIASIIQDEFRLNTNRKDRGVKQAGFFVLWQNSMPSVLVELGFISNQKEEAYLVTKDAQVNLASAIFRAFRDYKKMVEDRSTFTTQDITEATETIATSPSVMNETIPKADPLPEKKVVSKVDGVLFKVQVTVSSNPIPSNSPLFKNLSNVEELTVDGLYKYVVGNKTSYNETLEFCQQVKKIFPDAFIIAFKDGKPIPVDQARKLSTN
jgi:N-acetylmuramoyl-L-alanine amidase